MYDASSRSALRERGDYEAWLIHECLAVLQRERGTAARLSIEMSDAGPTTVRHAVEAFVGAGYAADVVRNLLPLIFAGAFKILDIVIEWCLTENGIAPRRMFFSFVEKVRQCRSGRITAWPDFLVGDAHLQQVLVETYAAVRHKRNAIVHDVWGEIQGGKLLFDFVYTDDLDPAKASKHDTDVISETTVVAFSDFAAFLFGRLADPSRQSPDDVTTLRRLSNDFQGLHGLAVIAVSDRQFFRVVRTTDQDSINIEEIIATIRKISPSAKEIAFELEIKRNVEKWYLSAQQAALLKADVQLSELSKFKQT